MHPVNRAVSVRTRRSVFQLQSAAEPTARWLLAVTTDVH